MKGLFQDTLPRMPQRDIAMLHLDGDWHDSVRTCLDVRTTVLYPAA